jgi:hypothetical protein
MTRYSYSGPDRENRDKLAAKLAGKGADVLTAESKRTVKPSIILREDKDDPDLATGVKEGEAVEVDSFDLESDKAPWEV